MYNLIKRILDYLYKPLGESSSEIDCGGVIWSREAIEAVKRSGAKWESGKKVPGPEWREY